MSLKVTSRFCGTVCILQCSGRIMAGQESLNLETELETVEQEFDCVILDLSEVTRMDSMGLGMLVRHAYRLNTRGGCIRLVAPQPFVAHLLGITKLSGFLQSYATEEEAIQSFLAQSRPPAAQAKNGRKLLVFDPSTDLCVFVRSMLVQHGFDVRTVCSLRDAKILLRVDSNVDYILVGPCTPQLAPQTVATELSGLAPKASTLQLGADFSAHRASEAAQLLLQMLGVSGSA